MDNPLLLALVIMALPCCIHAKINNINAYTFRIKQHLLEVLEINHIIIETIYLQL